MKMKGFLAKPGFLGTHGTLGADLSYLLAILFTLLFLVGCGIWEGNIKEAGTTF